MKDFGGWKLPHNETHLVDWMRKTNKRVDGRLTYQHSKLVAAMEHVKEFRCAVDVGSHIGLWAFYLAKKFSTLHAFEPIAYHRECFGHNVPTDRVILHDCALGAAAGSVQLHTGPSSSGDTYIKEGGEHAAEMRTLDSFELVEVDFIKIDCEGAELMVIKGGEQTIRRDKPCIIVEQKPGKAAQFGLPDTEAVTLLQSWGATLRQVISGDFILSF